MDTFGAAVGPLLAILLMSQNPNDMRRLYFWALVPGLLSVLVIFSIREQKHDPQKLKWENPFSALNRFSRPFKRYLFAWGMFSLTNSSDAFLLMRAKNSGLSLQATILLYCVYNLVYSLFSPWLGKLSDKINRKKLMAGGLFVFALVYTGFGFSREPWHYWALFLTYGLYMGATEGVGKALAVDLSPPDLRATSVGLLGTVTGICTVAASVIAGLIWDQLGASWAFFYGSAGALIASALLLPADRTDETTLK
jgi:MFS family permease